MNDHILKYHLFQTSFQLSSEGWSGVWHVGSFSHLPCCYHAVAELVEGGEFGWFYQPDYVLTIVENEIEL